MTAARSPHDPEAEGLADQRHRHVCQCQADQGVGRPPASASSAKRPSSNGRLSRRTMDAPRTASTPAKGLASERNVAASRRAAPREDCGMGIRRYVPG